jgi:hypothetical protein
MSARMGLAFFLFLVPAWRFSDPPSHNRLETEGLSDDVIVPGQSSWGPRGWDDAH